MQVAVMGHCLNGLLPSEERTVAGRVRAAAEAGITHVEPFGGVWPADVDCRRTAEEVRREGDRHGVQFPAFGSNTRLGIVGEKGSAALEALKREIEACQIIGAQTFTCAAIDAPPVLRAGSPDAGASFERTLPILLEPLAELAAFAAERGVRIGVLNHSEVVFLSFHQEWLTLLAAHPNAGATVDPGNYLYYASEDPVAATRRLASHAVLVRIGDWRPRPIAAVREQFATDRRLALWESAPLGDGIVDHVECFRLLRAAGFDGVVSLKSPGPPIPDAAASLQKAVARLREWLDVV